MTSNGWDILGMRSYARALGSGTRLRILQRLAENSEQGVADHRPEDRHLGSTIDVRHREKLAELYIPEPDKRQFHVNPFDA